jgi:hypothetical protein
MNEKQTLQYFKKGNIGLNLVPYSYKPPLLCEIAVKNFAWELKYVPVKLRNLKICKIALSSDGATLKLVPEHLINNDLCRIALINNSEAFSFIPKHLITDDFYEIIVNHDAKNLELVPIEKRTPELCEIALNNSSGRFHYGKIESIIHLIPDHLKTKEFYEKIIEHNGVVLEHIPEHLKTLNLCIKAVNDTEEAYKFVPQHIKEGKYKVNTSDITALKNYLRLTFRNHQTTKNIESFILKASGNDLKEMDMYINARRIPKYMLPIFFYSSNVKIKKVIQQNYIER